MVIYSILLMVCLAAGIVAEAISVTLPAKIMAMESSDPALLFKTRFNRFVFFLSLFYLGGIILMFFHEKDTVQMYALVLMINSVVMWSCRRWLRRHPVLLVLESTLCLTVLLATLRIVVRSLLLY